MDACLRKYAPSSLDTFLGNAEAIQTLRAFLLDTDTPGIMTVLGASGTGKTTLVQLTYAALGIRPFTLHSEGSTTVRQVRTILENYLNTTTLCESLMGQPKQVWIDDVDVLHHTSDKSLVPCLLSVLHPPHLPKGCKVVLCVGLEEEKLFVELKHLGRSITLHPPPLDSCLCLLRRVIREEGLAFSPSPAEMQSYVERQGFNVRNILLNVGFWSHEWTLQQAGALEKHMRGHTNLYDVVASIYRLETQTAKELELLISADAYMISLVVYENLMRYGLSLWKQLDVGSLNQMLLSVLQAYTMGAIMDGGPIDGNVAWSASQLLKVGTLVQEMARHTQLRRADGPRTSEASDALQFTTVFNRAALQQLHLRKTAKAAHGEFFDRTHMHMLFNVGMQQPELRGLWSNMEAASLAKTYQQTFQREKKSR